MGKFSDKSEDEIAQFASNFLDAFIKPHDSPGVRRDVLVDVAVDSSNNAQRFEEMYVAVDAIIDSAELLPPESGHDLEEMQELARQYKQFYQHLEEKAREELDEMELQ